MATSKTFTARVIARRRKIGRWLKSASCKRLTHKTLPLLTIFGVMAFVSYGHGVMYGLMAGESEINAHLLPVMYDALMFASIGFLSARHPAARIAAYMAFGYGFTMTLVGNIMASDPTIIGKVTGTSVGIGLAIVAIMVHFGSKPAPKRRKAPAKATQVAAKPVPVGAPAPVTRTTVRGVVATAEPAYR